MRILHTADWHLGDRLGRISRADDLRRAVERLRAYCDSEGVEVLLVAGDLFSDKCGAEGLREAIEHLQATFVPFLRGGGTIVALTGNHDSETFCRTLGHAFELASPAGIEPGGLATRGRLYLATEPTFFRLPGRDGDDVQFVLMPYPTPYRYLDGASRRFGGLGEKNTALMGAYLSRMVEIQGHAAFRPELPTVLGAHIHVQGANGAGPFRMSEAESIIFPEAAVPADWAYVALGHIHKPQALGGLAHVRYSGSIDRLDLGEADDPKGAYLIDVGPEGLEAGPRWLPLDPAPIRRVVVADPAADLPRLRQEHPDAARDLVFYELTYRAGVDDLDAVLDELESIFPRWYDREPPREAGEAERKAPSELDDEAERSLVDVVMNFLREQLDGQADRDRVLAMAESFLAEDPA